MLYIMDFKGKNFLFMMVVASMIIPLQMSLIPLVQLFKVVLRLVNSNNSGIRYKWNFCCNLVAHTGFGLPLATFLLRDFMMGLPKVSLNQQN